MRPLPETPAFTRDEARACGWSDSALNRAVRRGDIDTVRRGLFARAGTVDERVAAIAAAVAGSVVSHRSALLLHGLPIVGPLPDRPEITVAPAGRGSAQQAVCTAPPSRRRT